MRVDHLPRAFEGLNCIDPGQFTIVGGSAKGACIINRGGGQGIAALRVRVAD